MNPIYLESQTEEQVPKSIFSVRNIAIGATTVLVVIAVGGYLISRNLEVFEQTIIIDPFMDNNKNTHSGPKEDFAINESEKNKPAWDEEVEDEAASAADKFKAAEVAAKNEADEKEKREAAITAENEKKKREQEEEEVKLKVAQKEAAEIENMTRENERLAKIKAEEEAEAEEQKKRDTASADEIEKKKRKEEAAARIKNNISPGPDPDTPTPDPYKSTIRDSVNNQFPLLNKLGSMFSWFSTDKKDSPNDSTESDAESEYEDELETDSDDDSYSNSDSDSDNSNEKNQQNETANSEYNKEVDEWLKSLYGSESDFNNLVPPKTDEVHVSPNVEVLDDDAESDSDFEFDDELETDSDSDSDSDYDYDYDYENEKNQQMEAAKKEEADALKALIEDLARESAKRKLKAASKAKTRYSLKMEDID